jgi:hypothetical protein
MVVFLFLVCYLYPYITSAVKMKLPDFPDFDLQILSMEDLTCPITGEILDDPITVPCCGKAFSRMALLTWFESAPRPSCPTCNGDLSGFDALGVAKNVVLASIIESMKDGQVVAKSTEPKWTVKLNRLEKTKIGQLNITLENSDYKVKPSLFIAVVDRSGSMGGSPWQQVEMALLHIMGLTFSNPMVKTEIIAYESFAEIIDLNCTQEQARQKIKTMFTGGGTNFIAAFDSIRQLLGRYVCDDSDARNNVSSITIAFLTDGQSGRNNKEQVDYFTRLLKDCNIGPISVHAIGFGQYCDKDLLEGIRKCGSVEGTFRYAEPTDDGDTLCHKLTSLFEVASKASSVPLTLSLDRLQFRLPPRAGEYQDRKEYLIKVQFPINLNRFGQYRCWVYTGDHDPGQIKIDGLIMPIIEHHEELSRPGVTLLEDWLSLMTDELAADLLQLNSAPRDQGFNLHCALFRQKLDAVSIKTLNSDTIDRIDYIRSQVESLMLGMVVNTGKLGDLRFASQFGTMVKTNPAPTARTTGSFPQPLEKIKKLEWVEREIHYSMNNEGRGRNRIQEEIVKDLLGKNWEAVNQCIELATIEDILHLDNDGNNTLHLAAYCGRFPAMKAILEKFPQLTDQINLKNPQAETALTLSIKKRGYHKTIGILLDHGAVIPDGRAKYLEQYAISKGFSITADIIGGIGDGGSEINISMKPDYIEYLFNRSAPAINADNYLEICMMKCSSSTEAEKKKLQKIINRLLQEFNVTPTIEMLNESCIPPKPDDPETPFYLELAEAVLRKSPKLVHEVDVNGEGPLFKSAEKGSLPHLQFFLQRGVEIDRRNHLGNTPLWIATAKRYPCIIEELLDQGADPNATNLKGNPPLYNVCQRGPLKIAERLVSYGAKVDTVNQNGDTLVLLACRNGQPEILQFFLNYVDPQFVNFRAHIDGFDALFASVEADRPECIKILHQYGVNLEEKTDNDNPILPGATPLHLAAHYGRTDSAKMLLSLGANINAQDLYGKTCLHIAIIQGHLPLIKLFQNRADLSIKDQLGNTPIAYSRGHPEIRKALVNPALDILLDRARVGLSSEEERLLKEYAGLVGVLSPKEAINLFDENGTSPLIEASIYSNYNMAKILVELGADRESRNRYGLDAMIWAHWIGNPRMKTLLGDLHLQYQFEAIKRLEEAMKQDRMVMFLGNKPTQILAPENGIGIRMSSTLPLPPLEQSEHRGALVVPTTCDSYNNAMSWNSKIFTINRLISNLTAGVDDFLMPREIFALNLYLSSLPVFTALSTEGAIDAVSRKRFCSYLLDGLNRLSPFEFETYFSRLDLDRTRFLPDQVVSFDGLQSATTLWRVATEALQSGEDLKKGTIFIVKTKTARLVSTYSYNPVDCEVLLLPDQNGQSIKYRVNAWYRYSPICLGQANIRTYTFGIKPEEVELYLHTNKAMIIELEEC